MLTINRSNQTQMGGGGNDVVKSTNTNEIQILSAGYQKPAKTGKKYEYAYCVNKNLLKVSCSAK
jgi:hypothetical protein